MPTLAQLTILAPGLLGVVIDKGLRAALVPNQERWVLLVDFDADPGDDPATDWPDDLQSLRLVLAEQPGDHPRRQRQSQPLPILHQVPG